MRGYISFAQELHHVQRLLDVGDFLLKAGESPLRIRLHELVFAVCVAEVAPVSPGLLSSSQDFFLREERRGSRLRLEIERRTISSLGSSSACPRRLRSTSRSPRLGR